MAAPMEIDPTLLSYDLENCEVKGTITFRNALEIMPDTKRSAAIQHDKVEMLKQRYVSLIHLIQI